MKSLRRSGSPARLMRSKYPMRPPKNCSSVNTEMQEAPAAAYCSATSSGFSPVAMTPRDGEDCLNSAMTATGCPSGGSAMAFRKSGRRPFHERGSSRREAMSVSRAISSALASRNRSSSMKRSPSYAGADGFPRFRHADGQIHVLLQQEHGYPHIQNHHVHHGTRAFPRQNVFQHVHGFRLGMNGQFLRVAGWMP